MTTTTTAPIADPADPSEAAHDRAVWTRLLGRASPAATVTMWTPSSGVAPSAERIAQDIWDANAYLGLPEWRDVPRGATIAALARVLRREGGAA